jgi:hypothetical protein
MSQKNCLSVQNLINQINTYFTNLGSEPINQNNYPNTKGTYNNIGIINEALGITGSNIGNTTTDGYYVPEYSLQITQLINLVDLYVTEQEDYELCFTRKTQTTKLTTTFAYKSSITAVGTYEAEAFLYIPTYWDGCVKTKCSWSGWRDTVLKCDSSWDKKCWLVPSTYDAAIPFYPSGIVDVILNGVTLTATTSITYGSTQPTGDYTFINVPINGLPLNFSYYIYGINIEKLDFAFNSYDVTINGLGEYVSAITSDFTAADVQTAVNGIAAEIRDPINDALSKTCVVLTGTGINN